MGLGSGNHIADYVERTVTCEDCAGSGNIQVRDKDKLEKILSHFNIEGFKMIRAFLRTNKFRGYNDELPCPKCDGQGQWIERW